MPQFSKVARGAEGLYNERGEPRFPRFLRLPGELRIQIWECFCPMLVAGHRLWDIEFGFCDAKGCCQDWAPRLPTGCPREVVIMSAVHRESRQIMKRALPDCLPIHPYSSVLHFNQNNDVVLLANALYDEYPTSSLQTFFTTSRFHAQVQHLALGLAMLEHLGSLLLGTPIGNLATFSTIRTLYVLLPEDVCIRDKITWCVADSTTRYEKTIKAWSVNMSITYCWTVPPRTLGENYETPDGFVGDYINFLQVILFFTLQLSQLQIPVLPMIYFTGARGTACLQELTAKQEQYEIEDSIVI